MRQFDNKQSWLDLDGKPLAGRVKFCRLHTTELENIYDNQGNLSDNPIFTNTIGQLNWQVFLADNKDYTVRFEKYIGNGDMSEDEDNWLFQYSCDNLYDVFGVNVDSTTFQLVNNISDLRALDPNTITTRDNRKAVILGGYNTIGDKPEVMYVWNSTSIENDNGGSVIKVNSIATGRWELVNTFGANGIDVRHFGVFGADSILDATDTMSLKIGYANTYATSVGLPLYFPANNGLSWYKINNLNISGAIFAKDTRVFGKTGASSQITVTDDTSYLDVYTNADNLAVFTITGPIVKTSWGVNSTNCIFNPTYKLIIDSAINTNHKDFENIVVDCQYELIDHVALTNCQINAVKKLGDYTFLQGCKLTESMFSDSCDFGTVTVRSTDIFDIEDFPTTSKWMKLRNQLADRIVDFKGRTLDSSYAFTWTNEVTYKNAIFSNYNAISDSVNLDNCSGTLTMPYANTLHVYNDSNVVISNARLEINEVTFENSTVRLNYGVDILIHNLTVKNTKFDDSVNKLLDVDSLVAENSQLYPFIVFTNNATTCTVEKCDITTINAGIVKPIIQNCVIYRGIISKSNASNNIDFELINNVFMNDSAGFGHHLSSDYANAHVIGKWINNSSMLPGHFIIIDRTNIDTDEQSHSYVYEGNTGPNVLQKLEAKWTDVQIIGSTSGGPKVVSSHQLGGTTNFPIRIDFNGQMFRNDEHGGGHTNPDYYLTQFSMFTVGTRNIGQLGLVALPPQHIEGNFYNSPAHLQVCSFTCSVDEKERLWYSSNVGTPAGIVFINGYTWRITDVTNMYEISNFAALHNLVLEIPVNYHISKY